jgi:glyoxylase-like metal-dependent hydrolase (beta-lactamase superfamily II)
MIHEILPVGMLACNCSIFGSERNGECLVVDPGDDISEILAIVDRHGLKVRTVVVTHAHIDHIGGARKLKEATGALVYLHADDVPLYDHLDMQAAWLGMETPDRTEIDTYARDGDRVWVGGTDLLVMHTPGHTPGSISLWIPAEKKLVAGDTLFRDSIGRTDLPGGDPQKILRSIHDKYFALPEETVVVPGHGELTTMGREKERNPFLRGL